VFDSTDYGCITVTIFLIETALMVTWRKLGQWSYAQLKSKQKFV